MKTSDRQTMCTSASVYYYDFLCGSEIADVPEAVGQHIRNCDHCKKEVDSLGAALGRESSVTPHVLAAETANLELHMSLLGQPVDCATVKSFLAPLADPLLEVRVPTPITTHLRECPACAEDLAVVRGLGLEQAQLCRLGQILAEAGPDKPAMCRTAAEVMPFVAAMNYGRVDWVILEHIRGCADCRRLLFTHRQALCDSLSASHKRNGVLCADIAHRDLFDLCLPCGAADAVSPALAEHVSKCRQCMGKMQALLHTVIHIADRPNSGIVTCLTMADLARVRKDRSVDSMAAGGAGLVKLETGPIRNAAESRPRALLRVRPFLRPAAVAAGVMLVAMLALYGTRLKATDLGEVYARLAKVDTMHLKRIDPERAEVVQEIWVSPARGLKIFKDGDQYTLWDLNRQTRTVSNSLTGESQTVRLDGDAVEKVGRTLVGPMHILPSTKLSETPHGAKWYLLKDAPPDAAIQGMEVYEMAWVDKTLSGAPVYLKWRGYVQPETKLPVRTEYYSRSDVSTKYEPLQVWEITYPEAASIPELMHRIGL